MQSRKKLNMKDQRRIRQLLLEPETRIPGLPAFTRNQYFSAAIKLSPREKRRYLQEDLLPLHRWLTPAVMRSSQLRLFFRAMEQATRPADVAWLAETSLSACPDTSSLWSYLILNDPHPDRPERMALFYACDLATPRRRYDLVKKGYTASRFGLSGCLAYCGCAEEGVAILNEYLSLTLADYEQHNAQILNGKIKTSFSKRHVQDMEDRWAFLNILAMVLHNHEPASGRATVLLEAQLGLLNSNYDTPEASSILRELGRCTSLDELDLVAACIAYLGVTLITSPGRKLSDATWLLEDFLGIGEQDFTECGLSAALKSTIPSRLPDALGRAEYLMALARALCYTVGRGPTHAASLLESYFDFTENDYSPEAIQRKFKDKNFRTLIPDKQVRNSFGTVLGYALSSIEGRERHAVLVLETALGFAGDSSRNLSEIDKLRTGKLVRRFGSSRLFIHCLAVYARALMNVDDSKSRVALCVLENCLGIDDEVDFQLSDIASMIRSGDLGFSSLGPHDVLLFWGAYARAALLSSSKGASRAIVICEELLGSEAGIGLCDRPRSGVTGERVSVGAPQNISAVLQTYVQALRLLGVEDRSFFIRAVEKLFFPSVKGFSKSALASQIVPSDCIPLVAEYLACLGVDLPDQRLLLRETVQFFSRVRDEDLQSHGSRKEFMRRASSAWPVLQYAALRLAEYERGRGSEEQARSLERELMLHAEQFKNRLLVERLFDAESHPILDKGKLPDDWSTWTRDQEVEPDVSESDGALSVALGCFGVQEEVEESWQPRQQAAAGRLDREELLRGAESLEELVPEGAIYLRMLFENETPESSLLWWAWKRDESGVLRRVGFGRSEAEARDCLDKAVNAFAEEERFRFRDRSKDGAFNELGRAARQQQLLDEFDRYQSAFDGLVDALNAELDISHLRVEGEDVVFHAEGPLLSTPLAWLKAAEGPLWQKAKSTSSVVSLTLQKVAAGLDPPADSDTLCVHWDKIPGSGEKGRSALRVMEATRRGVYESVGDWPLWSLGAKPDGEEALATVANVRAALDGSRRFRLVVVNAHGDPNGGVQLADKRWLGDGVNLEGTDLLVLACCSVGQLTERSSTELEGFYAELAAQRCRTVVAASWKITPQTTERLVTNLTRRYAKATREAEAGRLEPFAKARLLAETRRELLSSVSPVCVPSIAAFDLYGVG